MLCLVTGVVGFVAGVLLSDKVKPTLLALIKAIKGVFAKKN